MKRKLFLVVLFLVLAMFLAGCGTSGIVTPDPTVIGGDAYTCENLLRGLYIALSSGNFIQALSYCKDGGLTFEYVNNLWGLAQEYPTIPYATYQVYDVYDFSYLPGGYLELYYDYSWTTTLSTSYLYGRRMVFEKIYGEWKMF